MAVVVFGELPDAEMRDRSGGRDLPGGVTIVRAGRIPASAHLTSTRAPVIKRG